MENSVNASGSYEEVEKLKDLVRKLEIQNEELRKSRLRSTKSKNGCIDNHNQNDSELCNESNCGNIEGGDISLETVELLDFGCDFECATDEEDSWSVLA